MRHPRDKTRAFSKGRRKLEFDAQKHQLPLINKAVYMDVKNGKLANLMEEQLKKLGARVEKFLSLEVHYVISSAGPSKVDEKTNNREENPQSPSFIPSPFNCGPSPSEQLESRTPVVSRGKALAQIACAKNKASTVVASAEKLGIKVVSIEVANKWLEKEMKKMKCHIKETKKTEGKQKENKSKSKLLRGSFLKFEDRNRHYRPVKLELDKWPKLNLSAPPGICPFGESKVKVQHQYGPRNQHPHDNVADCAAESIKQEQQAAVKSVDEGIRPEQKTSVVPEIIGVPIDNTGDARRILNFHFKKNLAINKQQGYCDCCGVKFQNVDEHLTGEQHRSFARQKSNYESLDSLINQVPSTASFLQSVLLKHCLQKQLEPSGNSSTAADNLNLLRPISPLTTEKTNLASQEVAVTCLKTPEPSRPDITVFKDQTIADTDLISRQETTPTKQGKIADDRPHAVVIRRQQPSGMFTSPRRRQPTPSKPWMQERSMIFKDSPIGSLQPSPNIMGQSLTRFLSDSTLDIKYNTVKMSGNCLKRLEDSSDKKNIGKSKPISEESIVGRNLFSTLLSQNFANLSNSLILSKNEGVSGGEKIQCTKLNVPDYQCTARKSLDVITTLGSSCHEQVRLVDKGELVQGVRVNQALNGCGEVPQQAKTYDVSVRAASKDSSVRSLGFEAGENLCRFTSVMSPGGDAEKLLLSRGETPCEKSVYTGLGSLMKQVNTKHQSLNKDVGKINTLQKGGVDMSHQGEINALQKDEINTHQKCEINTPLIGKINILQKDEINTHQKCENNTPLKGKVKTFQTCEINMHQKCKINIQKDEINTPQKGVTNTPQTCKINMPQKSEVNMPQKREVNTPQKSEVNTPNKSEVNIPQTCEINPPQKGKISIMQNGEINTPQNDNYTLQKDVINISQKCEIKILHKGDDKTPQKGIVNTSQTCEENTPQKGKITPQKYEDREPQKVENMPEKGKINTPKKCETSINEISESNVPKKDEDITAQENDTGFPKIVETKLHKKSETNLCRKSDTKLHKNSEVNTVHKGESELLQKYQTDTPQKVDDSLPHKGKINTPKRHEVIINEIIETKVPNKDEDIKAQESTEFPKNVETKLQENSEVNTNQKDKTEVLQKDQTNAPQKVKDLLQKGKINTPKSCETSTNEISETKVPKNAEDIAQDDIKFLKNLESKLHKISETKLCRKSDTKLHKNSEVNTTQIGETEVLQKDQTSTSHTVEDSLPQKGKINTPRKQETSISEINETKVPKKGKDITAWEDHSKCPKIVETKLHKKSDIKLHINSEVSTTQKGESGLLQKDQTNTPQKVDISQKGKISIPKRHETSTNEISETKVPKKDEDITAWEDDSKFPKIVETKLHKKSETKLCRKSDTKSHEKSEVNTTEKGEPEVLQKDQTNTPQKVEDSLPQKGKINTPRRHETSISEIKVPKKDEDITAQKDLAFLKNVETKLHRKSETKLHNNSENTTQKDKTEVLQKDQTNTPQIIVDISQNGKINTPKRCETSTYEISETKVPKNAEDIIAQDDIKFLKKMETKLHRKSETKLHKNGEVKTAQKDKTEVLQKDQTNTPQIIVDISQKGKISTPKRCETSTNEISETKVPKKDEDITTWEDDSKFRKIVETKLHKKSETKLHRKSDTKSHKKSEINTTRKSETEVLQKDQTNTPQKVEDSLPQKGIINTPRRHETSINEISELKVPKKDEDITAQKDFACIKNVETKLHRKSETKLHKNREVKTTQKDKTEVIQKDQTNTPQVIVDISQKGKINTPKRCETSTNEISETKVPKKDEDITTWEDDSKFPKIVETKLHKKSETKLHRKSDTKSHKKSEINTTRKSETEVLQKDQTNTPQNFEYSLPQKGKINTPRRHETSISEIKVPKKDEDITAQKDLAFLKNVETKLHRKSETKLHKNSENTTQKDKTEVLQKDQTNTPQIIVDISQNGKINIPKRCETSTYEISETKVPKKDEDITTWEDDSKFRKIVETKLHKKSETKLHRKSDTKSHKKSEINTTRKSETKVLQTDQTNTPQKVEDSLPQKGKINTPRRHETSINEISELKVPKKDEDITAQKDFACIKNVETKLHRKSETKLHKNREVKTTQKDKTEVLQTDQTNTPQIIVDISQKGKISTPKRCETSTNEISETKVPKKDEDITAREDDSKFPKIVETKLTKKSETKLHRKSDTNSHKKSEINTTRKSETKVLQKDQTNTPQKVEDSLPQKGKINTPRRNETSINEISELKVPKKDEDITAQKDFACIKNVETKLHRKSETKLHKNREVKTTQKDKTEVIQKDQTNTPQIIVDISQKGKINTPKRCETSTNEISETKVPKKDKDITAREDDSKFRKIVETKLHKKSETKLHRKSDTRLHKNSEVNTTQKGDSEVLQKDQTNTPQKVEKYIPQKGKINTPKKREISADEISETKVPKKDEDIIAQDDIKFLKKMETKLRKKSETNTSHKDQTKTPQKGQSKLLQKDQMNTPHKGKTKEFQKDQAITPQKGDTRLLQKGQMITPQKGKTKPPQKSEASTPTKIEDLIESDKIRETFDRQCQNVDIVDTPLIVDRVKQRIRSQDRKKENVDLECTQYDETVDVVNLIEGSATDSIIAKCNSKAENNRESPLNKSHLSLLCDPYITLNEPLEHYDRVISSDIKDCSVQLINMNCSQYVPFEAAEEKKSKFGNKEDKISTNASNSKSRISKITDSPEFLTKPPELQDRDIQSDMKDCSVQLVNIESCFHEHHEAAAEKMSCGENKMNTLGKSLEIRGRKIRSDMKDCCIQLMNMEPCVCVHSQACEEKMSKISSQDDKVNTAVMKTLTALPETVCKKINKNEGSVEEGKIALHLLVNYERNSQEHKMKTELKCFENTDTGLHTCRNPTAIGAAAVDFHKLEKESKPDQSLGNNMSNISTSEIAADGISLKNSINHGSVTLLKPGLLKLSSFSGLKYFGCLKPSLPGLMNIQNTPPKNISDENDINKNSLTEKGESINSLSASKHKKKKSKEKNAAIDELSDSLSTLLNVGEDTAQSLVTVPVLVNEKTFNSLKSINFITSRNENNEKIVSFNSSKSINSASINEINKQTDSLGSLKSINFINNRNEINKNTDSFNSSKSSNSVNGRNEKTDSFISSGSIDFINSTYEINEKTDSLNSSKSNNSVKCRNEITEKADSFISSRSINFINSTNEINEKTDSLNSPKSNSHVNSRNEKTDSFSSSKKCNIANGGNEICKILSCDDFNVNSECSEHVVESYEESEMFTPVVVPNIADRVKRRNRVCLSLESAFDKVAEVNAIEKKGRGKMKRRTLKVQHRNKHNMSGALSSSSEKQLIDKTGLVFVGSVKSTTFRSVNTPFEQAEGVNEQTGMLIVPDIAKRVKRRRLCTLFNHEGQYAEGVVDSDEESPNLKTAVWEDQKYRPFTLENNLEATVLKSKVEFNKNGISEHTSEYYKQKSADIKIADSVDVTSKKNRKIYTSNCEDEFTDLTPAVVIRRRKSGAYPTFTSSKRPEIDWGRLQTHDWSSDQDNNDSNIIKETSLTSRDKIQADHSQNNLTSLSHGHFQRSTDDGMSEYFDMRSEAKVASVSMSNMVSSPRQTDDARVIHRGKHKKTKEVMRCRHNSSSNDSQYPKSSSSVSSTSGMTCSPRLRLKIRRHPDNKGFTSTLEEIFQWTPSNADLSSNLQEHIDREKPAEKYTKKSARMSSTEQHADPCSSDSLHSLLQSDLDLVQSSSRVHESCQRKRKQMSPTQSVQPLECTVKGSSKKRFKLSHENITDYKRHNVHIHSSSQNKLPPSGKKCFNILGDTLSKHQGNSQVTPRDSRAQSPCFSSPVSNKIYLKSVARPTTSDTPEKFSSKSHSPVFKMTSKKLNYMRDSHNLNSAPHFSEILMPQEERDFSCLALKNAGLEANVVVDCSVKSTVNKHTRGLGNHVKRLYSQSDLDIPSAKRAKVDSSLHVVLGRSSEQVVDIQQDSTSLDDISESSNQSSFSNCVQSHNFDVSSNKTRISQIDPRDLDNTDFIMNAAMDNNVATVSTSVLTDRDEEDKSEQSNSDTVNDSTESEIEDLLIQVPTLSSPDKVTESSWGDICESYLSTAINKHSYQASSLSVGGKSPHSKDKKECLLSPYNMHVKHLMSPSRMRTPKKEIERGLNIHGQEEYRCKQKRRKTVTSGEISPYKKEQNMTDNDLEHSRVSGEIFHHTLRTPVKNSSRQNLELSPGIQHVDDAISFNYMSPQRMNFSPLRGSYNHSSSLKIPLSSFPDGHCRTHSLPQSRRLFSPSKNSTDK